LPKHKHLKKKTDPNAFYRYDKGEIRSAHFTPEGFLSVDAIVTRTGVFIYRNQDGSLRRELRHPDDVMKQDSLKSMEMVPITLLHPKEKSVDSLNASRLSKGFTGQSIVVDGKYIKNRLVVTDQEAINTILSGMNQLSLGYTQALIDESGEYDNERYDARQTDIFYNHIAIVPSARAGSEAKIDLGRNDAYQCVNKDENHRCDKKCLNECTCADSKKHLGEFKIDDVDDAEFEEVRIDNNNQPKEIRMKKITLDGIEYEAAPEVINALAKEKSRADKAEESLKTTTDEKTKLQAKCDETEEKLKKAEKRDDKAEVQKAVKARLDLVTQATPHLDEETTKKLDQMDDKEIKLAVIKSHFPEFKEDGKDDVYIDARYDGAVELKKENRNDAMSSQRQAAGGMNKSTHDNNDVIDKDKSRNDMMKSQENAWKRPEATGTDGK
jgi:hypothetical protein